MSAASTKKGFFSSLKSPGIWFFIIGSFLAYQIGSTVAPTWSVNKTALDTKQDANGIYYTFKGKPTYITNIVSYATSGLTPESIALLNLAEKAPEVTEKIVVETIVENGVGVAKYSKLNATRHWGIWSLLPAIMAIFMCFFLREPLTALATGIVAGAFLLGKFDISALLIDSLMTKNAASVVVLYLLMLGGLLGIWSRTGAAKAFAELMTKHVVKGPRSAMFVTWLLGVIFHQGGTLSTVLVGTTAKPLSDNNRVSHEELSYIVDSTASPIASILPFNAWPGYVQALIYVSGVSWLATETDRVLFFMKSIPFSFYSIFAVLLTLTLSLGILPDWMINKPLRAAIKRARTTGQLDARSAHPVTHELLDNSDPVIDAEPLDIEEIATDEVAPGYTPHVAEFFIPLFIIIGTSMGTFVIYKSPKVIWGFGIALVVAILMALFRHMKLKDLMTGIDNGLRSVVYGAVILIFAITIGSLSKETGGGAYLVDLLGNTIPYWLLPVALQLLTMLISFSTGTSWGTYAVTFPLAMPLSYAVALSAGLANPEFFMLICFTTVLNGSVFGDQCSPISDTTVLSAMTTGCDLMDHVRTQFYQAAMAATLAGILWTILVLVFA